mmetsp:Transcript_1831/g.3489  ORF Transcript_1831/g.3489 Transcript_1831/m.3489 type:complete len:444 (-) Transcript_1831:98-1429(-)
MEVKSMKVTTHSSGGLGGNTGCNGSGVGGNGGGGGDEEDGDFGGFLMSMFDEAPITRNHISGGTHPHGVVGHGVGHSSIHPSRTGHTAKKVAARSSYYDPNFRYAAPFLAGITSYMERNCVPFEHVDIWVPSTIPPALVNEGQGSLGSAPIIGEMGSGGSNNLVSGEKDGKGAGVCRLSFAGSATLGVQIVDEPAPADVSSKSSNEKKNEPMKKIAPLTGDEICIFSLFGVYSRRFSFASGCGLPGRVFQSGVTVWEQFLPNAPPEMFERRDGAIQFGINTALGFPIDSPSVGRIVVVLYSKHNREKDEELVNRMVKDVRLFNPCPRWKLVVDVSSNATISGNGNATSTKCTNTMRKCTPKRGQSTHDTLLEDFTKKKIKRHDDKEKARQESENDYNAKKVRLAKQFRAMTSALNGDKLRAAKVCPDFEIFLSTDEKVELAML